MWVKSILHLQSMYAMELLVLPDRKVLKVKLVLLVLKGQSD
jgi:hypothetical protein